MGAVLLTARLLLSAVFLVAGSTKLADRAGSRQAIVDFGLPPTIAPVLGLILPISELALAVALLPSRTAWWAAVGALMLIGLFIAGISVNLARGRKPDCHCFGQLHSAPIGRSTLVRNGVLAGLAAVVVLQGARDPGPSATAWVTGLTTTEQFGLLVALILLTLIAVEGWFWLQLLSQQGRLLLRLDAVEAALRQTGALAPSPPNMVAGLPVGTPAPDFELPGLFGERLSLEALRAVNRPVMLVFTDPGCGPCLALLPEIGRWQRDHSGRLSVAVVSRGDAGSNRANAEQHGLRQVLLQSDSEVAHAYRYDGTPSAVLVGTDGRIASPVAGGADAIRRLLHQAIREEPVPAVMGSLQGSPNGGHAHASDPIEVRMGQPAPPFALPDLNGKTVNLARFRGKSTLVLFWNPACSFCQDMLEDLKAWERRHQRGAPALLVVSTGSAGANRAMGLASPVLLDAQLEVVRTFGANGTPMAVLVDAEGKVASTMAAGAQAVLALARGDSGVATAAR